MLRQTGVPHSQSDFLSNLVFGISPDVSGPKSNFLRDLVIGRVWIYFSYFYVLTYKRANSSFFPVNLYLQV